MTVLVSPLPGIADLSSQSDQPCSLGQCRKGWCGRVCDLSPLLEATIPWNELERRLLEMGFVEGARVEVLNEGPIQHDPIAVRVDDITIALRRRDAEAIQVRSEK